MFFVYTLDNFGERIIIGILEKDMQIMYYNFLDREMNEKRLEIEKMNRKKK